MAGEALELELALEELEDGALEGLLEVEVDVDLEECGPGVLGVVEDGGGLLRRVLDGGAEVVDLFLGQVY